MSKATIIVGVGKRILHANDRMGEYDSPRYLRKARAHWIRAPQSRNGPVPVAAGNPMYQFVVCPEHVGNLTSTGSRCASGDGGECRLYLRRGAADHTQNVRRGGLVTQRL